MKNERVPLRCSFCDRSEDEAGKMVAGPNGVAICAQCVKAYWKLVHDEGATKGP